MPTNFSFLYGYPSLLDRLMEDQEDFVLLPAPEGAGARHFPPVQMLEDEAAVYITAFVPGVCQKTFNLEFSAGRLVLLGCIPPPAGLQIRRERPTGPFRREIKIPCRVMADRIEAVFRNGMLLITMPKQPDKARFSISVTPGRNIPQ